MTMPALSSSPRMVGRHSELAALLEAYDAGGTACGGGGSIRATPFLVAAPLHWAHDVRRHAMRVPRRTEGATI